MSFTNILSPIQRRKLMIELEGLKNGLKLEISKDVVDLLTVRYYKEEIDFIERKLGVKK